VIALCGIEAFRTEGASRLLGASELPRRKYP